MLFVSVVLFVLSLSIFAWIVYRISTTKKFKFKDVVYTIGIFIVYYFLLIQLFATKTDIPLIHIFLQSFKPAIKFVAMDFDLEVFEMAQTDKTFLSMATYIVLAIDAVLGFWGVVFVLFKVAIINKIRFFKAKHCFKSENKVVDSIFSFNDLTKQYLINLKPAEKKHTVVYINKFKDGFSKEQIKEVKSFLYANKIAYKEATINELAFRKCATKYDNNIISFFTENNEILTFTKEAKKHLDKTILTFNLFNIDDNNVNKLEKYLFKNKIPFTLNRINNIDLENFKFEGSKVSELIKESKVPLTNKIDIKDSKEIDYLINNKLLNPLARKNIHFIISTNREQNHFLKPILSETHGFIRSFDKYELCGLKFIQENNFAKYIRKTKPEIINDNLTIKDCDINLFFFGFGSMNKSLFEKILISNQFVEEKNGELVAKKIKVHVYDKNKDLDSLLLSTGLLNYSKSDYINEKDKYFDLPDDYRDIDFNFNVNINSQDILKDVVSKINNNKQQFNFFVVSLGDDFTNTSFADKLGKFIPLNEYNNNFIFMNTKVDLDLCSLNNNTNFKNNTYINFGLLDDLLNRDNVVLEEFIDCCKRRNYFYLCGNKYEENEFTNNFINNKWSELSFIKQYSNVSSIAGLSFKLSLLGFDDFNFDINEFNKKYFINGSRKDCVYDDLNEYGLTNNSKIYSARDVLAFIEHQRWNALELSLGVLPMPKEKIIELKGASKTKDETLHANLTTTKGLIEFYNFMHENADRIEGYTLINADGSDNSEVFKYDYQLMDDIEKYQKYFID